MSLLPTQTDTEGELYVCTFQQSSSLLLTQALTYLRRKALNGGDSKLHGTQEGRGDLSI